MTVTTVRAVRVRRVGRCRGSEAGDDTQVRRVGSSGGGSSGGGSGGGGSGSGGGDIGGGDIGGGDIGGVVGD